MGKFKYDELSVSNAKIIITIFSFISMIFTAINATSINALLTSSATYYLSNALTFYSVNPKSKKGIMRRAKILNTYMMIGASLFVCFIVFNNLQYTVVQAIMFFIMKTIIITTSLIAPYCAIKDDDEYKPKEVNEAKKFARKKLAEDKQKKLYSKRNKDVKMNRETKEFIEETDRKRIKEGRKV
ncbi:hypothetical protein IW492_02555 [Enterococcus sp. BWB1-3]|uniref:hypothetical protein n=1 Tax=Enterococcus sp. BWB1-3 TaxID=2787713 RepID=UPI001922D449|nr:hypothetical protein [Enterococcus sp. BWB1-3]MBL1228112.1 hypothetical protein [Enterococcus sp. BWB1-3]